MHIGIISADIGAPMARKGGCNTPLLRAVYAHRERSEIRRILPIKHPFFCTASAARYGGCWRIFGGCWLCQCRAFAPTYSPLGCRLRCACVRARSAIAPPSRRARRPSAPPLPRGYAAGGAAPPPTRSALAPRLRRGRRAARAARARARQGGK